MNTAGAGLLGKQGGAGCKITSILFQIKGTTSDPKFAPDVGGLASSMLKSQLGCAAGAVPGGPPGQSQNSVNAVTGLLGKKKKREHTRQFSTRRTIGCRVTNVSADTEAGHCGVPGGP